MAAPVRQPRNDLWLTKSLLKSGYSPTIVYSALEWLVRLEGHHILADLGNPVNTHNLGGI
jgi:hypothetical protein